MAALSFIVSLGLRLGDNFEYAEPSLVPGTIIFTIICASIFFSMRLYRGVWRYASIHDLISITKAVSLAVLLFLPIMFLYNRLEGIPRSVFIINWFVLLSLLGGPRFLYRLYMRKSLLPKNIKLEKKKKISVLLIGLNDHTEMFLRDVVGQHDSEYEVVGILDNDKNKFGGYAYNVKIFGAEDSVIKTVEKLRKKGHAPQKILFSPGFVSAETIKKLLEHADRLGLTFARIPRLTELKNNIDDKIELQPIAVEDLLGRPQAELDRERIGSFIKGKNILITGAGGTIGSEIVRQIANYIPSKIILLDNSEHSLYQIDKELEEKFPLFPRRSLISDVRELEKLQIIFRKEKPEIVFHAAALKHVPLSEVNAEEAVLTNVLGSKNIADTCLDCGVKNMVMISTDKAVSPTSIMGATKRIAELYVQALGSSKNSKNTIFSTVRFGNVLGSTGSVVPLFRRQIESGGPITITHPDITRYFMTIREAVELVLQSSVQGNKKEDNNGSIYVLDMGEPVKIKDLAYQMIRLAGLKPEEDIEIKYTGLRPGEKMFEELFYPEEAPAKTSHQSIMLARPSNVNLREINKQILKLKKSADSKDKESTINLIKNLIPSIVGEII